MKERIDSIIDGDDPPARSGVGPEVGPIDPKALTGRIGCN
jgi:hypothetical protein